MTITLPQPLTLCRGIASLFLTIAIAHSQARADETYSTQDWQIKADTILEDQEQEGVVAMGNVTLIARENAQKIVQADWLSYDGKNLSFKLRGHSKLLSIQPLQGINTNDTIILNQTPKKSGYQTIASIGKWSISKQYQKQNSAKISQKNLQSYDGKNWNIAAEQILQLPEESTIIANGKVHLSPSNPALQGQYIEADWLSYDQDSGRIKLRGNLRFFNGDDSHALPGSMLTLLAPQATAGDSLKPLFNQWQTGSQPLLASAVQDKPKKATEPSKKLATEEWDINADKLMRFEDPDTIIATGNVILKKRELVPPPPPVPAPESQWSDLLGEEQPAKELTQNSSNSDQPAEYKTSTTIYADWLAYDVEKGVIKAKGNVVIEKADGRLTASEGDILLENETGTFENASLRQQDKLYMEGKKLAKTGYDTYRIDDGWLITCKVEDGEEPPWAIVSSQTDIEKEGYAVLRHARFKVKGVPVFYTPYMIIPIKQTRQSGFLYPELNFSGDSGFGINTPFFWAISDSTDATFYPQYYANRGFMPGAEFRYTASADKKGTFNATYLHDDLSSADTKYTYQTQERYWIRAKADHTFGDNWLARLDLDIVSDKDYLQEWDSGIDGYDANNARYLKNFGRGFANDTDTTRENTLKLMKGWSSSFLEIEMLGVNDVRADKNGNSTDTNNPFWKLPSITYSGALPIGETPLTFDWNSNYVNYWRKDGYGGNRFDIHPKLSTSLPISQYLESRAELGVRDTYYMMENYGSPTGDDKWSKDDKPNRLIYDFETEIATTVERNFYGDTAGSGFNHQVRPYLRYNYVPEEDQDDLPFFDDNDRIDQQNGVTYGFDTYLNALNNGNSGSQKLHLEMYQTYRLEDVTTYSVDSNNKVTKKIETETLSNLQAKLKWYPWQKLYLSYKTELDMYGQGFVAHTLQTTYTSTRGDKATFEYSYKEEEKVNEINGYFDFHLADNWLASIDVEHSLEDDETKTFDTYLTYLQPCWSVKMGYESSPEDKKVLLVFELANIGLPLSTGYSFN